MRFKKKALCYYKERIIRIIKWFLPFGFIRLIEKTVGFIRLKRHLLKIYPFTKDNIFFKDIHKNKRCFILGSGPSVNKQDLRFIKNEVAFSLNFFYLHKDYIDIRPKYHLFSGLVDHPNVPLEIGLKVYKEMESKLYSDFVFFNCRDRYILRNNHLFENRKDLRFVDYSMPMTNSDDLLKNNIDMTRSLYRGYNIAVVAIQVAVYMGFNEIYLVGLDHDWVLNYGKEASVHFYNLKNGPLYKEGVSIWTDKDWGNFFWLNNWVWQQYKILRVYCNLNNIKIFNATDGGILDVFPRVKYEHLFMENKSDDEKFLNKML